MVVQSIFLLLFLLLLLLLKKGSLEKRDDDDDACCCSSAGSVDVGAGGAIFFSVGFPPHQYSPLSVLLSGECRCRMEHELELVTRQPKIHDSGRQMILSADSRGTPFGMWLVSTQQNTRTLD